MHLQDQDLTIRSITQEDTHTLWALAYRDNLEWMNWDGPYFNNPIYTWEGYCQKVSPKIVNNPRYGLLLYQGEIIGIMASYWEDGDLENWLEFGLSIFVDPIWGRNIGTRACRLWISYLFDLFPEIVRVGFTTWSGNIRMMTVGEKLGLQQEARIRKVRYYNNQYFDSMKYGVLRTEWQKELDTGKILSFNRFINFPLSHNVYEPFSK
ncbi:MAG TPA: GNAT family N-acetyltransferase [Candidatus Tetragenococcus pullicola]|nr:GNAT family N-acetyltransferase [Candidatus Tetragenococcus pullicola]